MSTKKFESFGRELCLTSLTHGVHLEMNVSRVDEEKRSSVNDVIIKVNNLKDWCVPLQVCVYSRYMTICTTPQQEP